MRASLLHALVLALAVQSVTMPLALAQTAPPSANSGATTDHPSATAAAPVQGGATAGAAATPAPMTEPNVVAIGTTAAVAIDTKIPHELSPWSMFMAADIIVKAVMIGLMCASVVTWSILFGKTIEIGIARRQLMRALRRIDGIATVSEARLALGPKGGLVSILLGAATSELELSGPGASEAGVKERVESWLGDLVRAEGQATRRGMGLLATIGSTAPFVGLFGTVWGIMNSFIGISKSQTTNLAVVAPGIAEALLATAVGLVAAIPAVVIYNHFSRATRGYQLVVGRASSAVGRLVSRELDRSRAAPSARVIK